MYKELCELILNSLSFGNRLILRENQYGDDDTSIGNCGVVYTGFRDGVIDCVRLVISRVHGTDSYLVHEAHNNRTVNVSHTDCVAYMNAFAEDFDL